MSIFSGNKIDEHRKGVAQKKKKKTGFDEAFNIFDEIDYYPIKLLSINLWLLIKLLQKSAMLLYLKFIKNNLFDMISDHSINKKINNANYKGYVYNTLKKKLENKDPYHAKNKFLILLNLKGWRTIYSTKRHIAERGKLEKAKTGTGIIILTPNKALARPPVLLTLTKGRNNWYKLKTKSNKYSIFYINSLFCKTFTF